MDNVKTGALIREARTARGMTQKQLAEALNITDRAVSKWERGLSAPDIALLEPLAEALGVTRQAVSRWETGAADPSTSNLLALAKLFGVSPEELLREID